MKIITVPHPSLRSVAKPITKVDKKIHQVLKELGQTLESKETPKGVGLAAPRVDTLWRAFVTQLPLSGHDEDDGPTQIKTYLNPVITKHSPHQEFGTNDDDTRLEGCLSIPGLYGPVPRWSWIELEYQVIESDTLVTYSDRFEHFFARVVQHELDHLDGILFTDYSLEFELPIYREDPSTGKLKTLPKHERHILETF